MHWGEAYEIGLDGDIWAARNRGSTDQLRAHTSHELRELIRTDYTYRYHASRSRGADEYQDDDPYSAHYDGAAHCDDGTDDDNAPAPAPPAKFANIRGERMST
jgi:hypothetical protein